MRRSQNLEPSAVAVAMIAQGNGQVRSVGTDDGGDQTLRFELPHGLGDRQTEPLADEGSRSEVDSRLLAPAHDVELLVPRSLAFDAGLLTQISV